jgi:UDP-sugar transporter A1/2/3
MSKDEESGKGGSSNAKPFDTSDPKSATLYGFPVKHIVLVLLTLQNAGAVLLMRYTRSMPGETEFITQTAVIMQEMFKGLACVAILMATEGTISSAWEKKDEALKTGVPALLYLAQNNLQYVAVGMLDAATYTVTYQSKTIWSGIFSVFLLGRVLKLPKWAGLAMLSLGVGVVQVTGVEQAKARGGTGGEDEAGQRGTGFMVIVAAAAISSLAGVYFEMILKGVRVSLWTRNLQLAFYSVLTAMVPLYASGNLDLVMERGFFYGYTPMTWTCIAMNAGGGLLVGTVIKYADAVTKDVAIGASIVFSSIASTQLFGFEISTAFVVGCFMVIYSVFLYGERATCCGLLAKS